MKKVIINISVFRRELLEQMYREVQANKHKLKEKGKRKPRRRNT